jgi:hypothetical protein
VVDELRGRGVLAAVLAGLSPRRGATTSTVSGEQTGQFARKRLWRQNVGTG